MTGINAFLYKIFGASWFTSVVGYIVMAGGIAQIVQDAITTNGIPTNLAGWITLAAGIGVRASKGAGVSNAQNPLAVAQDVVAETGKVLAVVPVPVAKP